METIEEFWDAINTEPAPEAREAAETEISKRYLPDATKAAAVRLQAHLIGPQPVPEEVGRLLWLIIRETGVRLTAGEMAKATEAYRRILQIEDEHESRCSAAGIPYVEAVYG